MRRLVSEAAGAADERTPDERAAALEPMLQSPNPVVRKSAVVALGKLGSPTAARMLCRALDDGDEGVRALSCQALGRLANQASLPALLSHAHDPSAGVRAGVLWGLANIAAHGGLSADARRSLFAPVVAMAFDPDDGVRADAAAVIGTLRDERATEALSTLLEDACPRVRANACASLGLTDDAAGMEFLLGMLERRENPLVQVSALDGVARRAERGAVPEESEASRRAVRDTCSLAQAASEGAPEASSEDAADAVGASDVRATAAWAIGFVARTAPSPVSYTI